MDLQDECPLGKLLNPSSSVAPGLRHIVQETRLVPSSIWLPTPPTALLNSLVRSGLQRARRSGRGLPTRFFVPSVMRNATAKDTPRPIHDAFHSQSLRFHTFELDAALSVAGPRPRNIQTTKITTAGTAKPMATRRPVEIFSFTTNGKEISGSVTSKGRLLGVIAENAAPTAAMALIHDQLKNRESGNWKSSSHYYYPVDDIRNYHSYRGTFCPRCHA